MRQQTQNNRALGINAGRQRREAAGNREEISDARRGTVFRQDAVHTGEEPAETAARIRAEKLEQIKTLRAQGLDCDKIARKVGYSSGHVRNLCRQHNIEKGK